MVSPSVEDVDDSESSEPALFKMLDQPDKKDTDVFSCEDSIVEINQMHKDKAGTNYIKAQMERATHV